MRFNMEGRLNVELYWLMIFDHLWQLREKKGDGVVLRVYRCVDDKDGEFRVEVSNKHCSTYRVWKRRFLSMELAVQAIERFYGKADRVQYKDK